jgi:hypothetical protein
MPDQLLDAGCKSRVQLAVLTQNGLSGFDSVQFLAACCKDAVGAIAEEQKLKRGVMEFSRSRICKACIVRFKSCLLIANAFSSELRVSRVCAESEAIMSDVTRLLLEIVLPSCCCFPCVVQ